MKIVNSIMPTSDIEALAANGQKLRVAVTKTSAQGKAAQSATPNLMSFSTDENSIWFNGKRFGVISLGESFLTLTASSNASTITTALNGFTKEQWEDAFNRGFIAVVKGEEPSIGMIYYYGSGGKKHLSISLISIDYSGLTSVDIEVGDSDENYKCTQVATNSLLLESRTVNALNNTSTTLPLSAAMGKKLQDEKLAKSDVVNNLTTNEASKALSAAQGKALNDRINGLGSLYKVKGTKTNISDVLSLTDAKVGDVWNVTNEFMLGGKKYPAGTNVVCVTATSSSDHNDDNWDTLGGTVDLTPYLTKSDASNTYAKKADMDTGFEEVWEQLGVVVAKDEIVNNLTSSETNKPLSAAMGKKLQDEKLAKTDVVNNLTTTDTTKALSAAQGKLLSDKFNGNKININFSATSNSTDNATIKGYMGNIDGATLVSKLTYGANLVDSSSEDWVITSQEVSATKVSFTGIRFAGFNLYSKNVSITISGSNYTNMTVAQGSRFVPAINNTLTSTSTSEALSAAQGKALNDKISALGSVYRIKGSKTNISEVLALTDAKVGDTWNVTNAFTFGGKPYPANTNVVCIIATSTSDHDENNWDPLGGTVDLSTYVPKSDIVDNLSTSDSKKPLSAKQGLALATMITELEDNKETYQLLKTLESGTLSTQSGIDAILGPYSSFNAALNAGKVIHGVYKDGVNRMNTVAFSAFNDTANSRVRMFAILSSSTLLYIQATYSGTNWTSATTSEEPFNAGITIE